MKTESNLTTAKKNMVCGLFVVWSSLLTSGEKADWLQLWLKPLGIKKLDQTGLSNTSVYARQQSCLVAQALLHMLQICKAGEFGVEGSLFGVNCRRVAPWLALVQNLSLNPNFLDQTSCFLQTYSYIYTFGVCCKLLLMNKSTRKYTLIYLLLSDLSQHDQPQQLHACQRWHPQEC